MCDFMLIYFISLRGTSIPQSFAVCRVFTNFMMSKNSLVKKNSTSDKLYLQCPKIFNRVAELRISSINCFIWVEKHCWGRFNLLIIMYLCRDEICNNCSWWWFTTGSRRCHRTQAIGKGEGRTAYRQINKDFHGK